MRNTVIDVIVKNQSVKKFDIIQQSMAIKALPHMDLVIRDKFSGKSPSKIKTKRQDNDLVIYTDKDDISLIVKDYYSTDDVGILGVQNNGVASYGLNSSQASQLLGGGGNRS